MKNSGATLGGRKKIKVLAKNKKWISNKLVVISNQRSLDWGEFVLVSFIKKDKKLRKALQSKNYTVS